jgi:hypothetical protein
MLEFDCDKCSGPTTINDLLTIKAYNDVMKYEVTHTGEIVSKEIPVFLYYECISCGETYRFGFKEVEGRIRKAMAAQAIKLKNTELRAQINPYNIDPDNGIESCGICEGVDGEGNCFVDYVKQCPIRKIKNA